MCRQMHIHTHKCIYEYIYMYIQIYAYVYMYAHSYICIYLKFQQIYLDMCVYLSVYWHVRTPGGKNVGL